MIKLQVIGNIGNDAVLRDVNGRNAINFSVAVNGSYKNKDGVKVEKTTWINCTLWRDAKQSTEISKYLKKGVKVYVEGIPSSEIYTNKEGTDSVDFKCNVRSVELLSSVEDKKDGASENGLALKPDKSFNAVPADADDDLPF